MPQITRELTWVDVLEFLWKNDWLNIVTCPECSKAMIHKTHYSSWVENETEVFCSTCNKTYETWECPDLYF